MPPMAATVECLGCHARENAVLALASTVYPEGWFIETIRNRATGASAQLVVCSKCRPVLAELLAERRPPA